MTRIIAVYLYGLAATCIAIGDATVNLLTVLAAIGLSILLVFGVGAGIYMTLDAIDMIDRALSGADEDDWQ